MNNRLKNEIVACLDTSALIELPSILDKVEAKLKNTIKNKHVTISEIIIPETALKEAENHVHTIIRLLEQIVEYTGGDKYKISKILTSCTMSKEIYLLDMLKCDELRRNIGIKDDSPINFVINLIRIINGYCKNGSLKEKAKRNMCEVLEYYQNIVKKSLGKLKSKRYNIKGSVKFFIYLTRIMRSPLTFILTNIITNKDIIRDVIGFYVSPTNVNIVKIDECMEYRSNDMIIYCHALVYSSNNSKEVVLVTKDRDFKNNEEKWKHEITSRLHIQTSNIITIRV